MQLNAPGADRFIQTCNKHLIVEWFGKKADRARRNRLCTRFYFRKSGQENDRQMIALCNHYVVILPHLCPAFGRRLSGNPFQPSGSI